MLVYLQKSEPEYLQTMVLIKKGIQTKLKKLWLSSHIHQKILFSRQQNDTIETPQDLFHMDYQQQNHAKQTNSLLWIVLCNPSMDQHSWEISLKTIMSPNGSALQDLAGQVSFSYFLWMLSQSMLSLPDVEVLIHTLFVHPNYTLLI